jgi:hypothetical protein
MYTFNGINIKYSITTYQTYRNSKRQKYVTMKKVGQGYYTSKNTMHFEMFSHPLFDYKEKVPLMRLKKMHKIKFFLRLMDKSGD